MATPFSVFTSTNNSLLTDALLAANSGIIVNAGSITLNASAQDAVNFYNGSLAPLGIGSGLLLTSGTTPVTSNTVGWFGSDNSGNSGFNNGDADINTVVNTVFQTQSYDATSLAFDFTVADPTTTSISFDIVFGSDEYPEWVDAFVDSAIVLVNGINYALFNHDPNHPLSVVSPNLAAGYFQDNSTNILPIEYDGVSRVLKIIAPINPGGGTNHIKIVIADTGDHIYDSGIFISNLAAGNTPGSGVVSTSPNTTTDNSDTVTGSAQDELIDLKGGDDIAYAGAGDDIVVAGAGNDSVYGGSGNDQMKGDAGNDYLDGGDGVSDTVVFSGLSSEYSLVYNAASANYTIADSKTGVTAEGIDTLTNVELAKFSNGLFAITTSGLTSVSAPPPLPTNTPGLVILSGVASATNILTATVSDPDGISGSVSYQWQTSTDNGVTWSNVGSNSNTYTITIADIGANIQVVANYTDNDAIAESPISASTKILETKGGDLVVTLLQLKAPLGASNVNPLTTLVQDAIDLGLSPNTAVNAIKSVLGIPSDIKLQTYDAYAILQTDPTNAQALAVEKVAVQIAILTSLSDDDTGLNLTSAIIKAASNNQTLDLSNANDLAGILGLNITGLTKANYPQPLKEIFDRNKSMSDAIADGGGISAIETEWQDLLSINDGINSTSIADLSIHINQAPIGTATASLIQGTEGSPYTLNVTDLLAGFSDSDGGTLSVTNLTASIAGTFTNNPNNTWTFTPSVNYKGPVELTYTVIDGQGGDISASQLFVLAPIPTIPIFTGTPNADTLIGSTGFDSLVGLAGNDTYTVNHSGDIVVEALNAGTDTVNASISYTLGNNVENLLLQGTAINGTGNELANSITGNASNNILNGGAGNDILNGGVGADTLIGSLGNDSYYIDNVSDSITENNGEGTDTVYSTLDYSLVGKYIEDLTLQSTAINGTGNELANTLTGNASNNILDGGTGVDTLIGGLGNDTYIVDNIGDLVTETSTLVTEIDTLNSSVTYTLANNLENLILTGTSAINGTGNALDNNLTGNSGKNTLNGGTGNDILDGGIGADSLVGGVGNDTYIVDNTGDVVTETSTLLTEIDTVKSSIIYTLKSNVENLVLTGTTAINGTGNTLNNVVTGNSGANTLNGGVGADTLIGGLGNEIYVVDNLGDLVTETSNLATEIDTVQASVDYILGANVENLTLTGSSPINGAGNLLNNTIVGNSGNNLISGGAGNDILTGNTGSDILVGNDGNDTLNLGLNDGVADIIRYTAWDGSDTINQFVKGTDKLAFTGISFIDVIVSGTDTQLRLGNGIAGDTGFGTGTLLETIKGVTGLTATHLGVGGTSVDVGNTAKFLFT
jgi:Ca2+-binding RTX toxin-like protein